MAPGFRLCLFVVIFICARELVEQRRVGILIGRGLAIRENDFRDSLMYCVWADVLILAGVSYAIGSWWGFAGFPLLIASRWWQITESLNENDISPANSTFVYNTLRFINCFLPVNLNFHRILNR